MSLKGASDNFSWLEKLLVVSRPLANEEMVENQTLSQRGNSILTFLNLFSFSAATKTTIKMHEERKL